VIKKGGGDWGKASAIENVTCSKDTTPSVSLSAMSVGFPGGQVAMRVALYDTLAGVSSYSLNINYNPTHFSVDTFVPMAGFSSLDCGSFGWAGTHQIFCGYPSPHTLPQNIGLLIFNIAPNTPFGQYPIAIDTSSRFFDSGFNPLKVEMGNDWLSVLPNDSMQPVIDSSKITLTDSTVSGAWGAVTDDFDAIDGYLKAELYADTLNLGGAYIDSGGAFTLGSLQLAYYSNLKLRATDGRGNMVEMVLQFVAPCQAPQNVRTTRITYSGARLEWDAAAGATKYEIRGRKMGSGPFTTVVINNGNTVQKDVGGLQYNATYQWQIKSYCGVSDSLGSAWSGFDSFTTGCFEPDSVWTTHITHNSARLNWRKVTGVQGYQIRGRLMGTVNWVTIDINGGNTTMKNVGGLFSGTTYQWQIRAVCDQATNRKSNFTALTDFTTANIFRRSQAANNEGLESQPVVSIFPNPTAAKSTLSIAGIGSGSNVSVELYDLSGKQVEAAEYNYADNASIEIDVAQLSEGIYQLVVKGTGFVRVKKLVIVK